MKKIYIVSIVLFLLGLQYVSAQESDKKALDVLEKVATKTKALSGFFTDYQFDLTDLADSANNRTYYGKMWYCNGKYKMEMLGQVIFSDGKTNWVYQEEVDEVTITDYSEEEKNSMIDPNYLLENYNTDYTCRFVSDKFERNRPLVEVHLFPKDIEHSLYSRIKLRIDKSAVRLYEFTFVAKAGVEYKVTLNKFKADNSITEEKVSFNGDLYPEAEIIDMRE